MRRAALLLYIVGLLFLTGCRGDLFASRRDMERLRPVQTLGLDREGAGVRLSVSSGIGPDGDPALVMSAAAGTIEAAIERLQEYSPEDELFYAHVRYLLAGESMAGGALMPLTDWVARSPSMRLGTPLILVKNGAAEAVEGAAGDDTDITQRLAALERESRLRGCHIPTLEEIAASLLDRGCALCFAVEGVPSEEVITTRSAADTTALRPAEYAVVTPDRLAGYLTEEEALGTELLLWGVRGARVRTAGNVLDLLSGKTDVSLLREENGAPAGWQILCTLRAGILERGAGGASDPDILARALETEAEDWLRKGIARSQAMGLDFLDLSAAGEEVPPERLLALPVTVTVRAEIDRSYDLWE